MAGCEFKNFLLGYSYDYSTSAIQKASSGSHEVFIGYSMKLELSKGKKNKHKSIGKNLVIPVPDAFFKCIYGVNNGKPQAIGFIMRNNDSKQSMNASAMTVDEVENITGMDLFPNLPDKIENKVESEMSIKNCQ